MYKIINKSNAYALGFVDLDDEYNRGWELVSHRTIIEDKHNYASVEYIFKKRVDINDYK